MNHLCLLVNPIELSRLPALNLLRLEPQSNLLLRALYTVGAVADIATDVDGIITSDGPRSRGKGVGGTEDGWSELVLHPLILVTQTYNGRSCRRHVLPRPWRQLDRSTCLNSNQQDIRPRTTLSYK